MRVVVDARMVGRIPHGFARYVSRMAEGLQGMGSGRGDYEIVFLTAADTPPEIFQGYETLQLSRPFLDPGELVEIPRVLKSLGASLYHSPTFSSLAWAPCPWIVTIHDLNHLKYGSLAQKAYYRVLLKRFAKGARALLTVSEFSRQELAAWLGLQAQAIGVVPNALEKRYAEPLPPELIERVLGRHGLWRGQYFFCLSNPKPHKNIGTVVRAYEKLERQRWPLVLSMTGVSDASGVRELGSLSDEEGLALLQGAGALVFPSLYEGFGLPPVEGALAGVPVIVSSIPPHREGLMDLGPRDATWVDPLDVDAWARAMEQAQRGGLAPAPPEARAKVGERYSVEALGRNMDRVYRHVLGLKP